MAFLLQSSPYLVIFDGQLIAFVYFVLDNADNLFGSVMSLTYKPDFAWGKGL